MLYETTTELAKWQLDRLADRRATNYPPSRFGNVTALVYHFWDDTRLDAQFDFVESAIYETWRWCGKLKTSLVVNKTTPRIDDFAARHDAEVSIHVNRGLVPGDLTSMSIDCNANLHRYFDTEYVLVIQNDGFPLRDGLGDFLGTCDYVGAPFVRRNFCNRLLGLWPRFAVGNGGFSLRTKTICEQASYYWNKRYHYLPRTSRFASEDVFYCFVLPFLERAYRQNFRFASCREALVFSYDSLYGEGTVDLPFGFHGQGAFRYLVEKGLLT